MTTAPTFSTRLHIEREQLRDRLRVVMGALTVERPAEQVERTAGEVARENAAAEVRRLRALLGEVECAIKRMELGCYGECVSCGDAISAKRLEALPWAADCIRCTAAKERA